LDITADAISYDAGTGVVEAEGNVTVTATREDGSTVTMRAERMTVEQ
jgi:lipopolysaccharide assembly outer membrane protein LptD (OstA)